MFKIDRRAFGLQAVPAGAWTRRILQRGGRHSQPLYLHAADTYAFQNRRKLWPSGIFRAYTIRLVHVSLHPWAIQHP